MPKKSKNPAYPDADPTAPGGMSQKALAEELVFKHGWSEESIARFRDGKKFKLDMWTEMIEAVIEARKKDEALTASIKKAAEFNATYAGGPNKIRDMMPLFIGMPDSKDYIFDGHSGASPSGAERWMTCTASLAASRAFLETLTPNQQAEFAKSGTAARQGTTAHAVAEAEARVMLGQMDEGELQLMLMELSIIPETEGEAYSEEMAEYVSEYTELVKSFITEGREVLIEERVTATIELTTVDAEGEYNLHEINGSADLIVMPEPDHPTLVVGDLKYGEGIEVEVEDNPQIRIYALGALARVVEAYDELPDWLNEVEYIIAQPRLGGIKIHTESVDDLLDWQDNTLSPALTEALGGIKSGAAFTPSEAACQWCPARGSCPALIEDRMEKAAELFDVIQETEYETGIIGGFPETASLDDAKLGSLYSQIRGLVSIADDLKAEVQRRLHRGTAVPGFHLVNYSPPRHWTEGAAEEVEMALVEHVPAAQIQALWTEKLVTPTAAEKALGKDDYERIKHLVVKPDIRPVAAPEGDRRKPWTGLPPEQMFTDLDEGES